MAGNSNDQIKQQEVYDTYKRVFSSVDGRVVLADLAKLAGIMSSGFTGNSTTFFNAGRKSLFFEIMGKIKGCPLENLPNEEYLSAWDSLED